jgi:hypothetical protein
MLVLFLMLMCTASLTLQKTIVMAVHNQYSDIELASPVYFYNLGTYYKYPVVRANTGTVMKIGFIFDLDKLPGGILMYKVRRKRNAIPDHQSSIDTIYAKAIEDVSKTTRLLVTWKIERSEKPKVNVMLVEHDNKLVLNEDKLAQLYDKVNNTPSGHDTSAWLIYGDKMPPVICEVVQKDSLELKVTVSTKFRYLSAIRPIWISSER